MIILTSDNNADAFIKSENLNNRQSNGEACGGRRGNPEDCRKHLREL